MSRKQITTTAINKDGKMHITKRDEFIKSCEQYFKENRYYRLIAENIYNKRSLEQNNYFHGVIIDRYLQGIEESDERPLGDEYVIKETGEILYIPLTREEQIKKAKRILKALYNRNEDGTIRGTHENSTVQQEELNQFCREHIFKCFGIVTELPNENLKIFNHE